MIAQIYIPMCVYSTSNVLDDNRSEFFLTMIFLNIIDNTHFVIGNFLRLIKGGHSNIIWFDLVMFNLDFCGLDFDMFNLGFDNLFKFF